jgi:2-polyprenyl-6-methoxyphenol hydroxylase-like FAD-dependent oxidoreductase
MTPHVLISGASFAGLSTAYWMTMLGYQVTIVEIAPTLKKGGTPVNIQDRTMEIVKRMGLLEQIRAHALTMDRIEFKNSADVTERSEDRLHGDEIETEYEIERDVLLDLLFHAVAGNVEIIFDDSIRSLCQRADRVDVNFARGQPRSFDLVFGCDGVHSTVRRLGFGPDADYLRFLGAYFSISIVGELLIPENTTQLYNEPGVAVMLNAYRQKTDVVLCFRSTEDIPYNYRDQAAQREIVMTRFANVGWRTSELLKVVQQSTSFYFDKLTHTVMPTWTSGRIALVGDAAYCPSPAAGRGGSVAIDGAAALADAFLACEGNVDRAFKAYNQSFRPFVDQIQAEVVEGGIDYFIPDTADAIRLRNMGG